MYISNDDLRDELEKSIEADRMTERFAEMACKIATGHIISRFPGSRTNHEFISAFHLAIVRNWKKIKPSGNIHGYLCKIAESRAKNVIRSQDRYSKRIDRYKGNFNLVV